LALYTKYIYRRKTIGKVGLVQDLDPLVAARTFGRKYSSLSTLKRK